MAVVFVRSRFGMSTSSSRETESEGPALVSNLVTSLSFWKPQSIISQTANLSVRIYHSICCGYA